MKGADADLGKQRPSATKSANADPVSYPDQLLENRGGTPDSVKRFRPDMPSLAIGGQTRQKDSVELEEKNPNMTERSNTAIAIISVTVAIASLLLISLAFINPNFSTINSRLDSIEDRFQAIESKFDINVAAINNLDAKLNAIADMTIIAHGNGEVTSAELNTIWARAAGEN